MVDDAKQPSTPSSPTEARSCSPSEATHRNHRAVPRPRRKRPRHLPAAIVTHEVRDIAPASGSGASSTRTGGPQAKWEPPVTSTVVESGGEVALLDALAPPEDAVEIWDRLDASPPTVLVVLKPDHVRDVDLFVRRYGAKAYGPDVFFGGDAPGDGAGLDRRRQRAPGRPDRALRRARPQRNADLPPRAAGDRLRRRADGAGRRARDLGHALARKARALPPSGSCSTRSST